MYNDARYKKDLSGSWKPVSKASAVFGKSLLKLDPYKMFGLCFLMVARFMWFTFCYAFFTGRKLINR